MRRKVLIGTIATLVVSLLPMHVFAGEVNGPESSLLGLAGGVYEKDGYYWSVKPGYGEKGAAYCSKPDVDLTWDDAANLAQSFYAAVGNPEYFQIVGEVPGYNRPQDNETSNSDETTTDPSAAAESANTETAVEASESASEVKEDTEDADNKDTEEPVSYIEKEAYTDGLTSIQFEEPKTVVINDKEVEVIKITEEIASVGDPNGLDELWEPARDYSNEKPIQKLPNAAIIISIIAGIAAVAIAATLIIHRARIKERKN